MRKKMTWLAVVLALTLVAAACGDDDESSTTTAAGTEAPAETEAPAGTEAPAETEAPTETTEAMADAGPIWVLLPDSASSPRWETDDRRFFEEAFTEAGVDHTIVNAEGKADRQNMTVVRDDFWASTSNKRRTPETTSSKWPPSELLTRTESALSRGSNVTQTSPEACAKQADTEVPDYCRRHGAFWPLNRITGSVDQRRIAAHCHTAKKPCSIIQLRAAHRT